VTTFDPDAIFQGAWVPPWLRHFAADPDAAIMELLTGAAELGHLKPNEPEVLLARWLDSFGEQGFATQLDGALARWIDRCWGKPALVEAVGSAALTGSAWCHAGRVIAGSEKLAEAAARLRGHVVKDRTFLDALTEGRSRDPLGCAWMAVANHQPDRELLELWWHLCKLPAEEPWYRGEYGIFGLRGLPPEQRGQGGGLPKEVPEGLLRLAEGLAGRVEEGWLKEKDAREEWQRIARLTSMAYPFPDTWKKFWRRATGQMERREADWAQGLSSARLEPVQDTRRKSGIHGAMIFWNPLVQDVASKLAPGAMDAIANANALLHKQALEAATTGDTYFLVRTACNFAGRLREREPQQALAWAELARRSDPWNAHAWNTTAACWLTLNQYDRALAVYEQATLRFPDDVVARNGLAEVLKARGSLDEAQAIYEETIRLFPDSVFARCGLAEVLRARGSLDEAQAVYEETIRLFPDSVFARTGLAGVRVVKRPRVSTPSPVPVAPTAPHESILLDASSLQILLTDVQILRRWGRTIQRNGAVDTSGGLRDLARKILEPFVETDARAAGELGLALLTEDDLVEARALLRDAQTRFPGSARVRYALARAERACAQREHLRLDAEGARASVIQPWRQLARMNAQYAPASLLGEGRAWCALIDGVTVEQGARDAFGKLARWTTQQRAEKLGDEKHLPTFTPWWANAVHTELFGDNLVRDAADLENIAPLRDRLLNDVDLGARLNRLEEASVYRLASV
jgi:tetratricopeptide (TPR) repeat protein